MTPDQETNMRAEIGEFSVNKLIDLSIRLQKTIDVHMLDKQGGKDSTTALQNQNIAMRAKLDELEGGPQVDSVEVERLDQLVGELNTRVHDLQVLNEGLQKKLIA